MKAVVKVAPGPGQVEYVEVPDPRPDPDQVLLEVLCCGLCGTDLHVREDTFRNFPPVTLGHEFVATVIEEGAAVQGQTDLNARYAVLGATAVVCGRCRYCRGGAFMFCPERRGMGHGVNGAFARYAVARPDQLFRLADDLPLDDGTMVEPLAAAVAAVAENTEVRPGDVVLVSGPGPIGLLCTLILVHQGIRTFVVGTSADRDRLALAADLGAAATIEAEATDPAGYLRDQTAGLGVDVAFEVSGAAASAAVCLDALRPLGRYTQVGHFGREIPVPMDHVGFKQLRVQGSVGYTRDTWERTVRLVSQDLRPSRVITNHLPLDQWRKGFDLFASKQALKVVLHPQD